MKRSVFIIFVLCLAVPVIGFAGDVTSRWDVSIGGYVKFDMGYATQAQNQDLTFAQRSGGLADNLADKYGSFYSYAGESRLNFLVKGPPAWDARTSAFIEGDFRGNQANGSASSNAGTFSLRHAFIQFDWPKSKLVIGQTWQTWGFLPTWFNSVLNYNDIIPFLRGVRQPLVRFEQTLAKDWTYKVGVISPTNTLGSGSVTANGTTVSSGVDGYTMSQMPFFEGSFGWSSDKCGNIGPSKMLFSLDGFYGRQRMVTSVTYANGIITFQDKDLNSWGMAFKGFIPVIPEKKGNKAGALGLSGVVFYTQNPGFFQGSTNAATFNANYGYANYSTTISNVVAGSAAYGALDYAAPTQFGGWGQLTYFFTDKLFFNGYYGYLRSNVSQAWMNSGTATNVVAPTATNNTNAVVNTTQIIGNILFDLTDAIRMGFEYSYYNTRYAAYPAAFGGVPTINKDGDVHSFRVGAWYFF